MPRSKKRRRRISAFVKILLVLTLVCGALVAGGYYIVNSIPPIEVDSEPPSAACAINTPEGTDQLELEQAANAATVGGVAFRQNLPDHAIVVAYATVWQESKFYNIEFGDRDSVGLFQQRPSMEWGEPEQLMDPVYSSLAFYRELESVPGYEDLPVYEAAQQVQRSADGFAYDQHEARSRTMMDAFSGQQEGAVHCWYGESQEAEAREEGTADTMASSDPLEAEEELTRVFGVDPDELPLEEPPRTGDIGWAMAIWAVSHARHYGLEAVSYGGYRWEAARGADGWVALEGAERASEEGLVLEY